jgi:hypothetical protein
MNDCGSRFKDTNTHYQKLHQLSKCMMTNKLEFQASIYDPPGFEFLPSFPRMQHYPRGAGLSEAACPSKNN